MSTYPRVLGYQTILEEVFCRIGGTKKIADQEQGTKPWIRGMQGLQAKSMYSSDRDVAKNLGILNSTVHRVRARNN